MKKKLYKQLNKDFDCPQMSDEPHFTSQDMVDFALDSIKKFASEVRMDEVDIDDIIKQSISVDPNWFDTINVGKMSELINARIDRALNEGGDE